MYLGDAASLAAIMLGTGLVAGVIAGLLGVGGGIVVVPVLEYLLRHVDMDPGYRMHVAVATSLATIIPTAISSARAHGKRGAVDAQLARAWIVWMLLGALAGSLLASRAHSDALAAVFGVAAALVALKMLLPLDHWRLAAQPPQGLRGGVLSALIGGVSAVMGIGGGTLAVPALTLLGTPIHRAVGTASLFGLFISVPGTLGYLLATPGVALPTATVGFVNLLGVLLIAPASMLTAPLGVRLAHWLSRRALSAAFGLFLIVAASRMLYLAFG